MLKANRAKIFEVQKFDKFWCLTGPEGQGVREVLIFTAKGTSVCESTSFKPLAIVSQNRLGGVREKARKSQRLQSHIGMRCRR